MNPLPYHCRGYPAWFRKNSQIRKVFPSQRLRRSAGWTSSWSRVRPGRTCSGLTAVHGSARSAVGSAVRFAFGRILEFAKLRPRFCCTVFQMHFLKFPFNIFQRFFFGGGVFRNKCFLTIVIWTSLLSKSLACCKLVIRFSENLM